jgi:hypothetical protein
MVQKNQRIKEKIRTQKKREQGIRKYLSRSTSSSRLRLGGLCHKKGRTTERANNVDKYREKKYMEQFYLFSRAYTRFFLAIAPGATPIGRAVVHPIERSRQKGRREVKTGDKEQVDGHEI